MRKHADATVVRVSAEVQDSQLRMIIIDNGRGFRPEETSGDGLGVQGMKERGGDDRRRLLVCPYSEPSGGTSVDLMPACPSLA